MIPLSLVENSVSLPAYWGEGEGFTDNIKAQFLG
jgi:hypothetical protein